MRHHSFRRFLHRTLRHSVWVYSQFLGSSLGTPGTFGAKPIHLTTKYDEERLAFLDSSFLRGSYRSSNKVLTVLYSVSKHAGFGLSAKEA